jgi:hypothetical protein
VESGGATQPESDAEESSGTAFELLIRATEDLSYPPWSVSGDAEFAVGDRSFVASILESSGRPGEFVVNCRDVDGEFHKTDMGPYGSTAPVFSATALDRSWRLVGGFLAGTRNNNHTGRTASVRFREREEFVGTGEVTASGVIYVGAPPVMFPDPLPVPVGMFRPRFMERGLRCRILGREALIRGLELPELAEFGHAIVIAWTGSPLPDAGPRALQILVSFILGAWVEPVMHFTVDAAATILFRRVDALRDPSTRKHTPPLELHLASVVAQLRDQFDVMFSRCETLLAREVQLDVAIGHLFAEHEGLDLEIRDVAIALSTLVESPLFAPPRRRLVQKARYQVLKAALLERLSELLSADEANFSRRVGDVLELACFDSTGDRRRAFWKAVGFNLSSAEEAALKHRDTMSHRGYLEFDTSKDEEWNAVVRDLHTLRTLVNRVLLSLLGFRGDAVSYVTGNPVAVSPAPNLSENASSGEEETSL